MKDHLVCRAKNKSYLSYGIWNELINICDNAVKESILAEVREVRNVANRTHFSVVAVPHQMRLYGIQTSAIQEVKLLLYSFLML